ncbi:hypothetical protein WCWAEYFT_CDS0258 [Vibrio phage VB_VaC_TDDLMA]
MEIYKICSLNPDDIDYVKPIALQFSQENNIVESHEWANRIYEDGLAGGGLTVDQLSPEQRKRISESKKGPKNPMFGKNLSKEHREKISRSNSGKKRNEDFIIKMKERKGEKRSVEVCRNIGDSKRGEKHPFFGKNLSETHRKRIGDANRGRKLGPPSDEHRLNISKALKEQKYEYVLKRAESNRGKKREIVICPHCGKHGGGGSMIRWHFDNCKSKEV